MSTPIPDIAALTALRSGIVVNPESICHNCGNPTSPRLPDSPYCTNCAQSLRRDPQYHDGHTWLPREIA